MSDSSADQNLLFGVLAVQLDFVQRDQLIEAMNAWLINKSKRLGEILVEQGALTPESHALLAALVKKHIEMHSRDVAQSLAAISSMGSLRDELDKIADDDVAASLTHVPRQERPADPYMTVAASQSAASSASQRFRILRPYAQGGLGQVSVAEDEELRREVALKEIRAAHADNLESRARFVREAEITGGLEHPNIVPVYGLGQYADGRPFYAMRFIRGDSLKDAIERFHALDAELVDPDERMLGLRKLLGRFIDVCNAIEYAHSRGVLHRDLKPGNIMLGKYGETLVVDWGLAKTGQHSDFATTIDERPVETTSGSGWMATQMGSAIGTPAYMSPEQAQGRLDMLGPQADVYSLGATLYHLLTGKKPFSAKDVETTLKQVGKGEFRRPQEIDPSIPPPLDAVCMKAMALQPDDRYPSAAALADDVELFLADEPVSVFREPFLVRAGRWVRKHRTLVSGTAAAVLVALLSLSLIVVLLTRANERERQARRESELQRERAEQNLQLARQAVDQMLTEVGNETLVEITQMEEVRNELLDEARVFYEEFRRQNPTDAALRMETALAHRRVGDIRRMLGQNRPAEKAYYEAIGQFKSLEDDYPDESEYRRQRADVYNWLGVLLKPYAPDEALKAYGIAQSLQQKLTADVPGNRRYRQELARSIYNRGIVLSESDQLQLARDAYQQSIAILTDLLDKQQPGEDDTAACRQELARCYNNLANLDKRAGRVEPAKRNYDRAIELMQVLADPDRSRQTVRREYKHELATYYNNLANLQLAGGNFEAAAESNRQAVGLFEDIAAAVPKIRNELANSYNSLGAMLVQQGKRVEAEDALQRARELLLVLVEQYPTTLDYQDRLGIALCNLGRLRHDNGDLEEAAGLLAQAVTWHLKCADSKVDNSNYRVHLGNDYWILAEIQIKSGNHREAAAAARLLPRAFPETSPNLPAVYYGAASMLSRCSEIIDSDQSLHADQKPLLSEEYASESVALLRQAVDKGFRDAPRLQAATADGEPFAPIRGRDDFLGILSRLMSNDDGAETR